VSVGAREAGLDCRESTRSEVVYVDKREGLGA
jgi:hypothetical protein